MVLIFCMILLKNASTSVLQNETECIPLFHNVAWQIVYRYSIYQYDFGSAVFYREKYSTPVSLFLVTVESLVLIFKHCIIALQQNKTSNTPP